MPWAFFMVKKTRFRKKTRLAKNPTWEYVKYVLRPTDRDHKQKIDNKPWHAAGPPDGSSRDGPRKRFGGRCRRRTCNVIDDCDGRRRQRRGHSSASLPRRRSRQRRLGGGRGVVHRARRPMTTTIGRHRRDDDPRPRRRRPSSCPRLLRLLPPPSDSDDSTSPSSFGEVDVNLVPGLPSHPPPRGKRGTGQTSAPRPPWRGRWHRG